MIKEIKPTCTFFKCCSGSEIYYYGYSIEDLQRTYNIYNKRGVKNLKLWKFDTKWEAMNEGQ